MHSRGCQLYFSWLLHFHEILILQNAEGRGCQRKRKEQKKALAEKKMHLAELTPTKSSHLQSSILLIYTRGL